MNILYLLHIKIYKILQPSFKPDHPGEIWIGSRVYQIHVLSRFHFTQSKTEDLLVANIAWSLVIFVYSICPYIRSLGTLLILVIGMFFEQFTYISSSETLNLKHSHIKVHSIIVSVYITISFEIALLGLEQVGCMC